MFASTFDADGTAPRFILVAGCSECDGCVLRLHALGLRPKMIFGDLDITYCHDDTVD